MRKYAALAAASEEMLGGRSPTEDEEQRLADVLSQEWSRALEHMLRHWETPPTITGAD